MLQGAAGTVQISRIEGPGSAVELSIEPDGGYSPWQAGIDDPVLALRDAKVAIPDAPGWGVRIRGEWLERANYRVGDAKRDAL